MKVTTEQIKVIREAYPQEWDEEFAADDPESAAEEVLGYCAKDVEVVYAWGPGEPYMVSICGVPGAYFVRACEFDPVGVFSSLEDARVGLEAEWAGVSLFDTEAEAWSHAEDEGQLPE